MTERFMSGNSRNLQHSQAGSSAVGDAFSVQYGHAVSRCSGPMQPAVDRKSCELITFKRIPREIDVRQAHVLVYHLICSCHSVWRSKAVHANISDRIVLIHTITADSEASLDLTVDIDGRTAREEDDSILELRVVRIVKVRIGIECVMPHHAGEVRGRDRSSGVFAGLRVGPWVVEDRKRRWR